MDYEQIKRRVLDEEHLRLLAIFHFVQGALTLLMAFFLMTYTGILSLVMNSPEMSAATGDTAIVGDVFGILAGVFGVLSFLSLAYGVALIVSGIFMRQRKARMFSFVVALPNLLSIPWGTLLSVFTLIVLSRESVKSMYTTAKAGGAIQAGDPP